MRSNSNKTRFNLGPTTAEPKVEAKSVPPVKPVRRTIPLFRPTQKPGKKDYIDIDIRIQAGRLWSLFNTYLFFCIN